MNHLHRLVCRSGGWRWFLARVLPWVTHGIPLAGSRVLELGSGPGLSTDWLRSRVGALTAVEHDGAAARALRHRTPDVDVHRADATRLPFADAAFDTVVCFTMLHHVPTAELQDRLFAEACRVLRPGGTFAGSDHHDGPLFKLAHLGDTCRPVDPTEFPGRLRAAGFAVVDVELRGSTFRFRATTPAR